MKRPRIAIPEMNQNLSNYFNALSAAGMEAVAISVRTGQEQQKDPQDFLDYSKFRVEEYDGLLLPGGGDINPARYGQEDQGSNTIIDELDDLQFSILDDFVKNGKPVLGICRGHQVLDVYFGGTMIQHLPTTAIHYRMESGPDIVHGCRAEKGSWLAEIYGTEFIHNSAHHQAVGILGEGLVVDGRCPEDDTVEAFHHSRLPVYGLQWHPERMCLEWEREDTVNGLPAFRFFGSVCGLSVPVSK